MVVGVVVVPVTVTGRRHRQPLVTRVGDRQVRSSDELVVAVRRAGADADVPVEVIRGGARVELTVRPDLG